MSSPGTLLLFCTAQQKDTFGAYDQIFSLALPAAAAAAQTARLS